MILAILHDEDLAEIKCHAHGWHNIQAKRWHYNGDPERPTFSPSVRELESTPDRGTTRCHYTVTDGKITYHGDCLHAFAGQTLDMLPFEQWEIDDERWVSRQDQQRRDP